MADSEVWEMAKLTGDIGEATTFPFLVMPVWCWRTGKGPCKRWQQVEYKAQEGKVDADVVISFDACKGCQMLGDDLAVDGKQLHEIKTNVAAFDKSIKENSNRTQNLFIELVQSEYWYRQNIIEEELDPLEGSGKKLPYRKGVGWWKKRGFAFDRGITRYDKAHWYHFYQPLDAWERLKMARDKEGNLLYPHLERPTGCEAQYSRATDDEIETWLWDFGIEMGDDAILITQIPVEICISVPCDVLKGMVDAISVESWGEQRHYNKYGELTWNKDIYSYFKDSGLLRAYKIPIRDVIPCVNVGASKRGEPRETQGKNGVLVSLVGEYVRYGTDGHRIKGLIPDTAEIYTPARLTGMMGERVNYTAFKNPYDKTGAIWVPRKIKEFMERVKKYDA
jgi:hypothetical protein